MSELLKMTYCPVEKVLQPSDTYEHGLVFGWLIACTVDGEPYVDLQKHHIPDDVMLEAAVDYGSGERVMKVLHDGDEVGKTLFLWPMTAEVAKAFGVETRITGLMIAVKPSSVEVLEKFASGELKGFSLGGDGWF